MRASASLGSSSEVTIAGVWSINPARLTRWNELYRYVLSHNVAFVANDMHVATARVDEPYTRCIDMRRTRRIAPFIVRKTGNIGTGPDAKRNFGGYRVYWDLPRIAQTLIDNKSVKTET